MLEFNPSKENCTGCAACYSVCPKRCIVMQSDEEGFLYPVVGEMCVHCGLCQKVCPNFIINNKREFKQKAIAAVAKDDIIWRRSSSGGAFSEICRHYADDNTIISGASWDGLSVHHIIVKGFNNIAPLCKSKYISSAINDTFIDIKKQLVSGGKAIFCGCPCQVAGLKAFLQKDFDNLLTIDLICHGQGSPMVFKSCIENVSMQLGEEVVGYQFRTKRRWYEVDYLSTVKTRRSEYYVQKDPYIQLFLSQRALRPSCGDNCKYRNSQRQGDITIADFKGMPIIFPELRFSKKNWSTIIINSERGEHCVNQLSQSMEIKNISLDDVVRFNPLFSHQTKAISDRELFFNEFKKDKQSAIKKWTMPMVFHKTTFRKKVQFLLPQGLLNMIARIMVKSI